MVYIFCFALDMDVVLPKYLFRSDSNVRIDLVNLQRLMQTCPELKTETWINLKLSWLVIISALLVG
jgi:hypothetical protein